MSDVWVGWALVSVVEVQARTEPIWNKMQGNIYFDGTFRLEHLHKLQRDARVTARILIIYGAGLCGLLVLIISLAAGLWLLEGQDLENKHPVEHHHWPVWRPSLVHNLLDVQQGRNVTCDCLVQPQILVEPVQFKIVNLQFNASSGIPPEVVVGVICDGRGASC